MPTKKAITLVSLWIASETGHSSVQQLKTTWNAVANSISIVPNSIKLWTLKSIGKSFSLFGHSLALLITMPVQ